MSATAYFAFFRSAEREQPMYGVVDTDLFQGGQQKLR